MLGVGHVAWRTWLAPSLCPPVLESHTVCPETWRQHSAPLGLRVSSILKKRSFIFVNDMFF